MAAGSYYSDPKVTIIRTPPLLAAWDLHSAAIITAVTAGHPDTKCRAVIRAAACKSQY